MRTLTALICFHGLFSSKSDFDNLSTYLRGYYDKIIAYDLPGHGQNLMKFKTKNIEKFVVDLYDSIVKEYDDIDVIGYSMGGVIACYLQSVRRVRKLILLAPAYRYLNLSNFRLSEQNINLPLPRKNYFHLFRFMKVISDLSDEFHYIYPKTLILWGDKDFLVKEESGFLLYQMTKDRESMYVILNGVNHFNILYSPATLQLICDYLNE